MTDSRNHDALDVSRTVLDRQQAAQNRIRREKALLLRDWKAGGGTEAEFEDVWPSIHSQLGKIRVMEIGDKARSRSLSTFRKRS